MEFIEQVLTEDCVKTVAIQNGVYLRSIWMFQ